MTDAITRMREALACADCQRPHEGAPVALRLYAAGRVAACDTCAAIVSDAVVDPDLRTKLDAALATCARLSERAETAEAALKCRDAEGLYEAGYRAAEQHVAMERTAREQAEAHVARLRGALQELFERAPIIALVQAALASTPADSAAELAVLRQVAEAARPVCLGMRSLNDAELRLPPALGDVERLRKALAALDAAKEEPPR